MGGRCGLVGARTLPPSPPHALPRSGPAVTPSTAGKRGCSRNRRKTRGGGREGAPRPGRAGVTHRAGGATAAAAAAPRTPSAAAASWLAHNPPGPGAAAASCAARAGGKAGGEARAAGAAGGGAGQSGEGRAGGAGRRRRRRRRQGGRPAQRAPAAAIPAGRRAGLRAERRARERRARPRPPRPPTPTPSQAGPGPPRQEDKRGAARDQPSRPSSAPSAGAGLGARGVHLAIPSSAALAWGAPRTRRFIGGGRQGTEGPGGSDLVTALLGTRAIQVRGRGCPAWGHPSGFVPGRGLPWTQSPEPCSTEGYWSWEG